MYPSPSRLSESVREKLAASLNERLLDSIDLHGQLKVAHWNVKGPQFAALHPLFETFAISLAAHTDALAERAVTLGALAVGTSRQVAAGSRIPDYPATTVRDLDHVRLLADRIEAWLDLVRETRLVAEHLGDSDTVDLVTGMITEFEKHAWFLRATLA